MTEVALPIKEEVALPLELMKSFDFTDVSERELLIYLIMLTMNAQREVMSQDIWYFIHSTTQEEALKNGMSHEKVKRITRVILQFQEINRKSNPMSGMF